MKKEYYALFLALLALAIEYAVIHDWQHIQYFIAFYWGMVAIYWSIKNGR